MMMAKYCSGDILDRRRARAWICEGTRVESFGIIKVSTVCGIILVCAFFTFPSSSLFSGPEGERERGGRIVGN